MENRAFNMDCLEAMREMPDLFFDLAVVDPPYGIGENGSKAASRRKLASTVEYEPFEGQDKEPPPAEYFKELVRVSKNQIIFGAFHKQDTAAGGHPVLDSVGQAERRK